MRTAHKIAACIVAAGCELAALVLIIEHAKAPTVPPSRCWKPWLSRQDERATCAIEEALTQRHAGKPRPTADLRTGWKR